MTNFMKQVIGRDEKIVLRATLHWIYLVVGFLWFGILTGIGFAAQTYLIRWNVVMDYPLALWFPTFLGTLIFFFYFIKVFSTEIGVTERHIVYKTGLMFVDVKEIDITELRAEHVHHGFLGRFLGYGSLRLDSRFVGDINIPAISRPYNLLKAVHSIRKGLHDPLEA